jgi:hypothetical protein
MPFRRETTGGGPGSDPITSSPIITPFHMDGMGAEANNYVLVWSAAGTWPLANRALAWPFSIDLARTLRRLGAWINVSSGNMCLGVYDADFERIATTGSVATPAAGFGVEDVADLDMARGQYYMALSFDNIVVQLRRGAPATGVFARLFGMAQMDAAFPLPQTFVPAALSSAYVPASAVIFRTAA